MALILLGFPGGLAVEESAHQAGDMTVQSERSHGERNGYLPVSLPRKSMNIGAWRAAVPCGCRVRHE